MRLVGPLVALLLLAGPGASAAFFDVTDEGPEPNGERPRFLTDAGSYLGAAGPVVVLGFQVPYSELFFRPFAGRFRASFELILALDQGNDQVGGDLWTEAREVASYGETRDGNAFVRRAEPIPCGAGRFRAEVTLHESSAGLENKVDWRVHVPDYERLPLSLSSLWVDEGADSGAIEVPPSHWVMRRRFGEPLPPLSVVGQVYRPAGALAPMRLVWRIEGARREEVRSGELSLEPARVVPFRVRPDLSTLWFGDYTFVCEVACGGEHARRSFAFQMEETAAAMERDPAQSLDLIGIVATPEELRELKDTPPGERKEAWNRFWKRRDPTPDTPENEFKDEFFARVRYTEEHFAVLGPGWKSDRGRIYLRYGPPDEIESHPENQDGPPYEVWTYTTPSRRFVFVDYDGFGRYELYQPGRS